MSGGRLEAYEADGQRAERGISGILDGDLEGAAVLLLEVRSSRKGRRLSVLVVHAGLVLLEGSINGKAVADVV
jgi:hypothetical protein